MTDIDISNWQTFTIGELFTVSKGKRLTKANMKPGPIPFVSAIGWNNGISAYIGNDEHIQPAHTITVCYNGAAAGVAFYQEERFWASDDVNVLNPRFPITRAMAMAIMPIITIAGKKYDFLDKWGKDLMVATRIPLPARLKPRKDEEQVSGTTYEPDYEVIEAMGLKVMHDAQVAVDAMISIVPAAELRDDD